MAAHQLPLIVLDEFDRIEDEAVTKLMADAIKALSDYSVNATVVIVGVAEEVTSLIKGHESIARSLIQKPAKRRYVVCSRPARVCPCQDR